MTDEKLYKEMRENCLKEAEKYRWENVIRRWERLIKELVGEKMYAKKEGIKWMRLWNIRGE